MVHRCIFLLLLALWPMGVLHADVAFDVNRVSTDPVALTPYLSVLEDSSLTLGIQDVQGHPINNQFRPLFSADAWNVGYTSSAYWWRVVVRNSSNQPIERMLELRQPTMQVLDWHEVHPDGSHSTILTGVARGFASRAYPSHTFAFPLTLGARSERVLFIRLQSNDSLNAPLYVWEPQAFRAYERSDYFWHAWYFGMTTTMLVFSLLLWWGLEREPLYLLYATYVLAAMWVVASLDGYTDEFLWPQSPRWATQSILLSPALLFATMILWLQRMLDTAKTMPRMHTALNVGIAGLLLALASILVAPREMMPWSSLILLPLLVEMLVAGLIGAWRGQRSATYFVLAFLFFFVGVAFAVLRQRGMLPMNWLTMHALPMGSLIEMSILSLALVDRYHHMVLDHRHSQDEALQAREQMVQVLKSSEAELEQRVNRRTEQLVEANRKLEALSTTDGLTGLSNRRRFDMVLESEWHRAQRSGGMLALLMVDIDHFKLYNDHYGHLAGDDCLRQVAQVLGSQVQRSTDVAARYGGEEFALILPSVDQEGAMEIAQKCTAALRKLTLPHSQSPLEIVTASMGLAVLSPSYGQDSETLVKAADTALYLAKRQGRNQVVVSEMSAPSMQMDSSRV